MPVAVDIDTKRCQIARTLDIVGEKWSLLIVRNAVRGQTRFSDFRDSLGVPSDILTSRLATLVEAGILEKRSYREPGSRERSSYHLTESGQALKVVLAAMIQWGEEFNPSAYGPASLLTDPETHAAVELAFVPVGDARNEKVAILPGPGSLSTW
jgi:DNA-binding HxlR family transcriptional regulator